MSLTPYWNGLVENIWKAIGLPKSLGKSPGNVVNYPIQGPDAMFFWTMENRIYRRHIDNDITEAILETI